MLLSQFDLVVRVAPVAAHRLRRRARAVATRAVCGAVRPIRQGKEPVVRLGRRERESAARQAALHERGQPARGAVTLTAIPRKRRLLHVAGDADVQWMDVGSLVVRGVAREAVGGRRGPGAIGGALMAVPAFDQRVHARQRQPRSSMAGNGIGPVPTRGGMATVARGAELPRMSVLVAAGALSRDRSIGAVAAGARHAHVALGQRKAGPGMIKTGAARAGAHALPTVRGVARAAVQPLRDRPSMRRPLLGCRPSELRKPDTEDRGHAESQAEHQRSASVRAHRGAPACGFPWQSLQSR